MAADFVMSAVLLLMNVAFICLGGLGFSMMETRGMEKRISRYMNISDQIISAAESTHDAENISDIVYIDEFMGNASDACTAMKTVPWTYGQSFYFALSVMTTVGWGVMSPSYFTSKLIVAVYAFFGIPLYAIFIGTIKDGCGKLFRKLVRVPRDVSWYWIPLCVTIIGTLFMNIAVNLAVDIGQKWLRVKMGESCDYIVPYEHWQANASVWDGIYFQFITVSTIGFGDEYHGLQECKDNSTDSICVAIKGFVLFSVLLGMTAHMFDVLADQSQSGLSSLSSKLTKRFNKGGNRDKYGNRTYGRI